MVIYAINVSNINDTNIPIIDSDFSKPINVVSNKKTIHMKTFIPSIFILCLYYVYIMFTICLQYVYMSILYYLYIKK